MYRVKRLCFNSNGDLPCEDNPAETFDMFEEAWNFAETLANQEKKYLNSDCDEGISFGIPMDDKYEKKESIRIEYYYNPDGDDTGNTEIVTKYFVCSDNILEKYNSMLKEMYGQNITVQIKSYIEDDGNTWFYFTSVRYGDSDAYASIEEAYKQADMYLKSLINE